MSNTLFEAYNLIGIELKNWMVIAPMTRSRCDNYENQIKGWKLSTDAVHSEGRKIVAQFWHTGSYFHPDLHSAKKPLASSRINPEHQVFTTQGFKPTEESQSMTFEDIKKTIQ